MPSIKIREIDTTSPGTLETITNVVYVPGFINPTYITESGESSLADAFTPVLCTSISEFEENFGAIPASFAENQYYSSLSGFAANAIPTNDDVMFEAGTMDPGYIYAKELLAAGLPVLYERINTEVGGTDITVEYMYNVLNEGNDISIWENLKDLNEYDELKFLTSGGYPTFEYSDNKLVINGTDVDTSLVKLNADTFRNACSQYNIAPATTTAYTFKYAPIVESADVEIFDSLEDLAEVYNNKRLPDEDAKFFTELEKMLFKPVYINLTAEEADEAAEEEPDVITKTFAGFEAVPESEWKIWVPQFSLSEDGVEESDVDIADFGITFDTAIKPGIQSESLYIGATLTVTWPVTKNSSIAAKMIACAASRGDCVALIDHTDCYDRPIAADDIRSVYYSISNSNSDYCIKLNGEFAAMFTPWCGYSFTTALTNSYNRRTAVAPATMAPSFFYLIALAKQVSTENSEWLAIAGSKRGLTSITKPNLIGTLRMTSTIADSYQPRNGISINAIANVKPFGYTIWGNRTLMNNASNGNLVATSFLNIRNVISSVKKTAFLAAKYCMFEQNSDILWLNYSHYVETVLDEMVSGAVLTDYTLTQLATTEKAKLVCKITLYPIYAVEAFDITVELADDEVTVE